MRSSSGDLHKMPRRIELAKHATLDRLEDANCARNKRSVQTGELAALRNAHRSLRVLEQLYSDGNSGKRNSGKPVAEESMPVARRLVSSKFWSRADHLALPVHHKTFPTIRQSEPAVIDTASYSRRSDTSASM